MPFFFPHPREKLRQEHSYFLFPISYSLPSPCLLAPANAPYI